MAQRVKANDEKGAKSARSTRAPAPKVEEFPREVPGPEPTRTETARVESPRVQAREEARPGIERFPTELLRGLALGRGVLFIGPGVARIAGLRLREILRDAMSNLLRQHIGLQEAEGLEAFLERSSTSEIAQALQDQMGRERYLRLLEQQMVHRDMPPPPLLYALRGLGIKRILTTNCDRLIERAFENPLEDTLELQVVVPHPGGPDPLAEVGNRPTLLKLFGDLQTPSSLVLTSDEYEAYWRQRPELVQRLKALLEVGPALFVGFSLHDPEFRRLYSQVGALLARAHKRAYAIMEGTSRFELQWWQQRALTVLRAQDAQDIERVVRELHRQVTRQSHPGTEIESDASLGGRSAGASWPLTSPMRQLTEQHLQWWLLPGALGPLQVRTEYVPLDLNAEVGAENERETRLEALLADPDPAISERLRAPQMSDIHTALEDHTRLMILGPAGSGKTTLLLSLLKTRSEAALEAGERFLVLYQPLRLVAANPRLSLMECLLEQLRSVTPKTEWEDLETTLMDTLLDGRALLLLDGLDEMPSDSVPGVLERVGELAKDCPKTKIVMACRSGAFEQRLIPPAMALTIFEVAPFNPEQAASFIRDQLGGNERSAESLMALLRVGVAPWLERLATNPLHLLLICHRYETESRFDDNRPSLYASYLNHLLRQSGTQEGENQLYAFDKELILQDIALYASLHPLEPLTEATVLDIVDKVMSAAHIAPMKDAERGVDSRAALDEICRSSGVLAGPGPKRQFTFRHSALREYLTARRLMTAPERENLLQRYSGDLYWAGVWRLLAAMEPDATEMLKSLDASLPRESRLIQRCFGEAQRVQPSWLRERFRRDPDQRFGVLLSRLQDQLSHQEAIELYGEILWHDNDIYMRDGRRSDTRALQVAIFGLQRLIEQEGKTAHQAAEILASWHGTGEVTPDAPWPCTLVDIPQGDFLMGDGDSPHQRYYYVPAFQIGRDPLTVAQYLAFNPSHTLEGGREMDFMGDLMPIVGVSWFDAWVCAQWYRSRLPTEAEWEKAAAWDSEKQLRRAWPWGDEWEEDRCNSRRLWKERGCTTPVDRFIGRGESPAGCRDMAGNVLEWTLDSSGGVLERKVLKGGSWQAEPHLLRCAQSVWLRPGYAGMGVGFRLARGAQGARHTPGQR